MVEEGQLHCTLRIEGINLKDLDTFSKSDPICVVDRLASNDWVKVGQTERIKDNLNPVF